MPTNLFCFSVSRTVQCSCDDIAVSLVVGLRCPPTRAQTCKTALLLVFQLQPKNTVTIFTITTLYVIRKCFYLSIVNCEEHFSPSSHNPLLSHYNETTSDTSIVMNIGVIHVIRHAEGIHNIENDKTIFDPDLSRKGLLQAKELHDDFPYKRNVGMVITSPLRRTLRTAIEGFSDVINRAAFLTERSSRGVENGVPLLLDPDLQAHSARPCDTGSDIAALQDDFPEVSLAKLDIDWHIKKGVYAPDDESLHKRARHVRQRLIGQFSELAKLSEGSNDQRRDIVVVSHGGFITLLMEKKGLGVPAAKWRSFNVLLSQANDVTFEEINNST